MNVAGQSVPPLSSGSVPFSERRNPSPESTPVLERRQFVNSHSEISAEARELGQAIDQYKLVHRRRFITYEEMLTVIKSLGYRRDDSDIVG
ncbi:MAG: hypothetical protein ACR2NP_20365 [Pirellulaceae bacterium]